MLGNLHKKVITDLAIPSARNNLPGLVSNITSNAINIFERKMSGILKAAVKAAKGFTLFISNEDMNIIIKIIKSSEHSGVNEKVKHEIKNKKVNFLELC